MTTSLPSVALGPRRKNAAFTLCMGLLSLTSVGVRCFAIGENSRNRRHFVINPPPNSLEFMQNYRSGAFGALFAAPDENDNAKNNLLNFNSTSSTPESSGIVVPADAVDADTSIPPPPPTKEPILSNWPCLDTMDRKLIAISLPVIANFAINPLIGAVDLFWVNRMGNALAVAGQSAANQVFSSAFWFSSFLPSGKKFIWMMCREPNEIWMPVSHHN
jgi:hypothetical protein